MLDPLAIASIISAIAGIGSTAYSMFQKTPELEPDFWRKYYSPERMRANMEPIKQLAEQRLGRTLGQAGERWGGRGLLSSAGAVSEVRGAERDYGQLMAEALSRAHAGEIGMASELGMADWERRYQEQLAKRSQYAQLGGQMMGLGAEALTSADISKELRKEQAKEDNVEQLMGALTGKMVGEGTLAPVSQPSQPLPQLSDTSFRGINWEQLMQDPEFLKFLREKNLTLGPAY